MHELDLLNELIHYIGNCKGQVDLVYLYTETLNSNADDKYKKEILDVLNDYIIHRSVDQLYSDLVCEADMILERCD